MHTRRFTLVLATALFSAALPAAAPAQSTKVDVTGAWTFTVTTDQGSGTPTVTFRQQGDSISGHYSSQLLGERILKGTVKDGKISFSFGSTVQGTDITVTYTGVVETSDAMKGTVDFGGYGSGTFTGTRKKS